MLRRGSLCNSLVLTGEKTRQCRAGGPNRDTPRKEARLIGGVAAGDEGSMSLRGVSSLILDDNAHMRGIMRAILVSFGVREIHEASDAAEAFEMMGNGGYDVAFVDFRLEGLDGLEFCRLVRKGADSPNPFLPIIMITAYSERSRVMEAVNAGVDEFLVKPIRAIDVASRLNAVVERRRPFVRSPTYFGPDRRRRADPRYRGPLRRATDPGTIDL